MRKLSTLILLIICTSTFAQEKSLAEKLGYSKTDKLLIVHADDIGMAHSENIATISALKNGIVNSTSIMMPCAWSTEVGKLIKDMPDLDIGIHITLTNEWHTYKYAPIASKSEVPGLVGPDGFMYKDCASVAQNASPEEVEKEMRAQIEAALKIGIKPSHLDSHMGCVFYGRPEYLASYIKLAQEYGIPAMLNGEIIDGVINPNPQIFKGIDVDNLILIDRVAIASPQLYDELGMEAFYTELLNDLKPGITVLLNHIAFDDAEMRAITTGFTHWHAKWRQDDYNFFTSQNAKDLIETNQIKLITWKEIGKVSK
ncbi:polysaccharide deacetylase family protein [Shivajiella indica]|uniref:Polysaccharide deacetylase family protein n=1 Tax=Shivajiella indica TaxID=872115 RepID=A0ABW5B3L2_9BACT